MFNLIDIEENNLLFFISNHLDDILILDWFCVYSGLEGITFYLIQL